MRHPQPAGSRSRPAASRPSIAPDTDTWTALVDAPLPTDLTAWATRPSCGGVVTFTGTVRDHAEGRRGVTGLTYEAYESAAEQRLAEVAAAARGRWSDLGRVALLHRVGALALGDVAVVVAASAPHRDTAFDAARWCIDTVKATVPIWKFERWAGGAGWGTGAQPLRSPSSAVSPSSGLP